MFLLITFFALRLKPFAEIGRPSTCLFGALTFSTVHLQRQAHYNVSHMLVFYDVKNLINSKEVVTADMNIAGRMCKSKLRVGQCKSDPGIT
ncbi:hypothetical protein G1C97_1141 [Bifidobacterium sp. DSM 109959]|uniref:Uncharacterized protein n=1 Tax=Bifidobacterium olomucense TaxID=2675324 RepID=A0A7Y0HXC9_9BIFI|nr:hypothetical protein [Bifidobacterium sp. DSM 109959]